MAEVNVTNIFTVLQLILTITITIYKAKIIKPTINEKEMYSVKISLRDSLNIFKMIFNAVFY